MLDFEKEFESFVGGSDGSPIRDIYTIIPSLTQEQMQILQTLEFYISRYALDDVAAYLDAYKQNMKKNKNLSFLSSMNMKALLGAYTQNELIRGIKVSSQTTGGNE